METSKNSSWENFGKLCAVLAAIATIVGVYVAVFPNSEDVKASVRHSGYILPSNLTEAISNVMEYNREYKLRELLTANEKNPKLNLTSEEKEQVSETISAALSEAWTSDFQNEIYVSGYQHFFLVEVSNTGEIEAKNVVLDLPFSGVGVFENQDGEEVSLNFKKTINLQNIRPGNKIDLSIWSKDYFSLYSNSGFILSHNNGTGEVEFVKEVSGFDSFIIDNKFGILLLLLLFSLFSVLNLGTKDRGPIEEEKEADEKEI